MKNWQDIDDPADRWLGKYTYESVDRWPSKSTVQILIQRYPADAGAIYRGINFDTPEAYKEFLAQLPDMTTHGITSWTRSAKQAEQFAVTKPSYFLNLDTMKSYDKQQQEGERLSGYRGLILTTEITDHMAIDVNKSHLGHESEIILPAGTYHISVYQTIKRYADELTDSDQTVEQIIKTAKSRQELSNGLIQYVLHHHGTSLSLSVQRHIFKLLKPTGQLFRRHVLYDDKVAYGFSADVSELIGFADTGVLTDSAIVEAVRKVAATVIRQVLKTLKADFMHVDALNLRAIAHVAKFAGKQTDLINIAKAVAAPLYRDVNRRRSINDRNELLDIQTQLKDILSRVVACCS